MRNKKNGGIKGHQLGSRQKEGLGKRRRNGT